MIMIRMALCGKYSAMRGNLFCFSPTALKKFSPIVTHPANPQVMPNQSFREKLQANTHL